MIKSSLPVLRGLLLDAGYRVLLRTNGWAECFVQREAERWEGRGQTEADALDDVLGKMFPSHLARELFSQSTDARRPRGEAPGDAVPAQAALPYKAVGARDSEVPARVETQSIPHPIIEPRTAAPTGRVVTMPRETIAIPEPPVTMGETPKPPAQPVTMGETPKPPAQPVTVGETPRPLRSPARPAESASPAEPPVEMVTMGEPPEPPVHTPALPAADLVSAPEPLVLAADAPAGEGAALAPVEAEDPTSLVDADAVPPAPAPSAPTVAVTNGLPANESTLLERPARVRPTDALESVERLLTGIEDRLGQLARMCGERQRLHMMVWICRARAIEEAQPGAREVEHAVARVARRLTEIGKMFWPGSVRALQLSARPADVRREMHATWASEPANWHEATGLAERLLDEHLAKSQELGLDEDGWADASARTPRPADPDALFEEVDTDIKSILVPPGEVPNGRAGELSSSDFEQLLSAARRLRWVRGGVRDDLAWGVAVGRIRRAIPNLGERAARVRDVLDHRHKPSAPWAKVLGELPAEPATAAGESPADLRAALPAASVTKEGLLAWLIRAFDVINTPDLVALVVPLKHELTGFSEDTLNHPDRRVRRRLRELVKRVASADEAGVARPKSDPPARDVEETSDEPIAAHALDALASRVREQTQGRRVLFVSNREDPELGTRLEDMLGIEITWCDGSLRRVQAQCERIKGGSYNMVLSATGFQVHGVDSALARASSTAGVPYVRVNRGRPVACVQAIAREFGLFSGTYNLASAKASSAD